MDIFNLHKFRKRIVAVVIILSIILTIISARLFYVQVINGGYLQMKATEQWTRDLPVSAERGSIIDRNGATLAVSYTTYDIYVRGREVKDAGNTAKILSEILSLDYLKTFEKVSNVNISEVLLKISSLSVAINPPLPTLMIFGEPVEAIITSEFLPNLFSTSPTPAEASSMVNMLRSVQYLFMDLMSCSAVYPAKLVKINAELSLISNSSK